MPNQASLGAGAGDQVRLSARTASTNEEMIYAVETSGSGSPSHSPRVPRQNYTDVDTGQVYNWLNGAWAT